MDDSSKALHVIHGCVDFCKQYNYNVYSSKDR